MTEQTLAAAPGNRYLGAAFYLIFGVIFLGFGSYAYFNGGVRPPDMLLLAMGAFS